MCFSNATYGGGPWLAARNRCSRQTTTSASHHPPRGVLAEVLGKTGNIWHLFSLNVFKWASFFFNHRLIVCFSHLSNPCFWDAARDCISASNSLFWRLVSQCNPKIKRHINPSWSTVKLKHFFNFIFSLALCTISSCLVHLYGCTTPNWVHHK